MSTPPKDSNGDKAGTVQSVDRAVTILELLAQRGDVGVTTMAAELGVHKSTASRLVAALERRGLVEQIEERGRYRLGVGILRLAGATNARLDLVQEARPVCRRLAAETGETVNVVILSGGAALYIDQIAGPSTLSSYNWVGQHIPLHATSNGKVLLSELAAPELSAILGDLTAYTPSTVTDRARLIDELNTVRAQGYAIAADELDVGLTAVAAPIHNAHGEIVASVSVSGPTFRIDHERRATLIPTVIQAADEISLALGWVDPKRSPRTGG
ncbi:MAG: IclR family transcriptional regulator [Phycicoccus sp.]|nr:IclR family transcriptional regulator [Phycicoccus sp.]